MSDTDETPKSAFELAMERLRAQDEKEGREAPRALSAEEKKAIAGIRARYEAKIAEAKIMQDPARMKALEKGEPSEIEKLDEEHRKELARLETDRDREIEEIRARKTED